MRVKCVEINDKLGYNYVVCVISKITYNKPCYIEDEVYLVGLDLSPNSLSAEDDGSKLSEDENLFKV